MLGYVNRYSWAVLEVQDRLEENGNGLPEFDLDLITAFLVKERISPRGMEAKQNAIAQGYLVEENESKTSANDEKPPISIASYKNVYEAIKLNRKIKYSELEDNLGIGETTIFRAIAWLKENGYINPDRSKIKGEWQLL